MKKLLIFILFWLIVLTVLSACIGYDESIVESIRDAYSGLVDAKEKGADVREATLKLDRALQFVRETENNPENRSVIRGGGVIAVITPIKHRYFYAPGHVYAYSKKELESVLLKAGLSNIHTFYGHSLLLKIKEPELLRKIINWTSVRWFKEVVIAKAVRG